MNDAVGQMLPAWLTPPVPGAPMGAWQALLLFLVPVGGGIPAGVLIAHQSGISPLMMMVLYFVSDVILAFIAEPIGRAVLQIGRLVPPLRRLGQRVAALFRRSEPRPGSIRGPLGIVLVSFSVDPMTGRAAAAASGHGFVSGWLLAIAGDMLYFALLMVCTIWLSATLGDQRLTIGVMLVLMFVLPSLLRGRQAPAVAAAQPAMNEDGGVECERS